MQRGAGDDVAAAQGYGLPGRGVVRWRAPLAVGVVVGCLLLTLPVSVPGTGLRPTGAGIVRESHFEFASDVRFAWIPVLAPAPGGGWFVGATVDRTTERFVDYALARLKPSGSLDHSALQDGRALLGVSGDIRGVTGLEDGGALLLGVAGSEDAAIVRVRADGTPDPSFGNNGVVLLQPGRSPDNYAQSIAARVLASGKILVAGGDDRGAFIARLLPTGALDPDFGTDGIAHPMRGVRDFFATDLFLVGRGRAVIVGEAVTKGRLVGDFDSRNFDFAAARVDRRGRPDRTFGRNGMATVPVGRESQTPDYDFVEAAGWVQRRLMLAGYTGDARVAHVTRLRPNGEVDRRYGRAGWWRGPRMGDFEAVTADLRGRTWFAYHRGRRTVVRRVTATGKTDRRIGRRGVVTFDPLGGGVVRDAEVTQHGRLLIAYENHPRVRMVLVKP
jgi:uncharacterized delta-60 repeat protein